MMNKHLAIIACCLLPAMLAAQKLPHTDILLLQLSQGAGGAWQSSAPKFLTAFNPKGYNNQPMFFSGNELWIAVQMPQDTTQTEIYNLNLITKQYTRVTETPKTAEYSPAPMPGGKRFSAVCVEPDGNQRLYSFPFDRSDNGRVEFPNLLNTGYYCWLNDTLAAFFIVGDNGTPHTLQIVGTRQQTPRRLNSNIGRCLQKTSDGKLAFVAKPTEQTWFLKTWNPQNNAQDIVVKMPAGSEDFAILPNGAYLTGDGARLYAYKPGKDTDWREVTDLGRYGVKKISRIAVNKEGEAAVVVE